MNFITSYSAIRDKQIFRNGELLFSGKPTDALDEFLQAAYDFLNPNYPKFYKMDRLSQLGLLASLILLEGRKLNEEYGPEETAVVFSNASSSLETDKRYFESTQQIASPSLFVYTLPNIVAAEVCIRHGLKGENAFFITEQFDTNFITNYANHLLSRGSKSCIVGWVEYNGKTPDVFLYLVEEKEHNEAIAHTGDMVNKLYNQYYGSTKN